LNKLDLNTQSLQQDSAGLKYKLGMTQVILLITYLRNICGLKKRSEVPDDLSYGSGGCNRSSPVDNCQSLANPG
jgi:hypothetical protein